MNITGFSKSVTAIEPDGTKREFDSISKASRHYGIKDTKLARYAAHNKDFQQHNNQPAIFFINQATTKQPTMTETNDYAYIACAREHYYHKTTSGRSYKSDLCSKYHISAAFTPYMDRMTDTTTDAEILDWKKEMQDKERQRREANLIRMKEEMQKAEPVVPQESKPSKEDSELLTLLRSIDENLKTLVMALK